MVRGDGISVTRPRRRPPHNMPLRRVPLTAINVHGALARRAGAEPAASERLRRADRLRARPARPAPDPRYPTRRGELIRASPAIPSTRAASDTDQDRPPGR